MSAAIKEALSRVEAAKMDLCETVQKEYPPGSEIMWKKRADAYCEGNVIRHGYGGRIFVRNRLTSGTYWIQPENIGWK